MYKKILILCLAASISLKGMETYGSSLEAFRKEYVNHYYPAAKLDKELLIEHAPTDLKRWFQDIKDGNKPQPALMYGAYGVGKTMTAQILTQETNTTLCYVPMCASMRSDSRPNRFETKYLESIDGNICLLLDNVNKLTPEDSDNLQKLIDLSRTKNNVHLLVIAYHAKKYMNPTFYSQFRAIKFPMPDEQKKLAVLQKLIKDAALNEEVNEEYLKNFLERVPNCSNRTIHGLKKTAKIHSHLEDSSRKPLLLSRRHFELALQDLIQNRKEMELVFTECE